MKHIKLTSPSGNCLRIGRDCVYTAGISTGQPTNEKAVPDEDIKATLQAILAKSSPKKFTAFYCAPHHKDVSSSTLEIMQQSQEISRQRPMPRSCSLTIAQDYSPRYVFL